MTGITLPEKYKAPLQSRAKIVDWITRVFSRPYHDRYNSYWFHWNVKCYDADFSFDHLADVWDWGYVGESEYVTHDELVETLRRMYVDDKLKDNYNVFYEAIERAQETVHDCDTYKYLWNGTNMRAEWAFLGRGGGHLCLTHVLGYDLAKLRNDYGHSPEDWLNDLDYADLRNLYKFLVQCTADFRAENVRSEIEYCAADYVLYCLLDAPTVLGGLVAEKRRSMEGAGI